MHTKQKEDEKFVCKDMLEMIDWLRKHGYTEIAIKEIDLHQKILLGKTR